MRAKGFGQPLFTLILMENSLLTGIFSDFFKAGSASSTRTHTHTHIFILLFSLGNGSFLFTCGTLYVIWGFMYLVCGAAFKLEPSRLVQPLLVFYVL